MNRRDLLQGVLACAGTAAALAAAVPGRAAPAGLPFNHVLFDERSPAGQVFAATARRLGADTLAVGGGVTRVWQERLQPDWRIRQTPTAGLTDYPSFFVLDLMAQTSGLRAVYLAHHLPEAGDRYAHRRFGPHGLEAGDFARAGPDWGRQAAELMMRMPAPRSVGREHSNILDARNHEVPAGALVSWVIAPVRRT